MRTLTTFLTLSLASLLGTSSLADVLVVDSASGPGTDYTSISSAIAAAAEGDVLLVRSGTYNQSHVIDGKSLTLQAEAGASVLALQITIRNLSSSQSVAIRGIDMQAFQLGSALEVVSCQGSVWIEDADLLGTPTFTPFPGGGVAVSQSSAVILSRCVVEPFEHQFLNPGLSATQSTVTLHASTVNGVKGFDQAAGSPNPGGTGLSLSASTLFASDTTIVGGAGGNFVGFGGSCRNGGNGGTGAVLTAGSTAHLFGSSILGGPGGTSHSGCTQGPTGPIAAIDESSTINQDPGGLGFLTQTSPVRQGASFTTDVTAEPGAFAWSLYGTAPTSALASPAFLGAAHVSLAPLLLEPLGLVPASGSLQLTLGTAGFVSPGADSARYFSQVVTFSPTDRRIRIGGGTMLTVLDASF